MGVADVVTAAELELFAAPAPFTFEDAPAEAELIEVEEAAAEPDLIALEAAAAAVAELETVEVPVAVAVEFAEPVAVAVEFEAVTFEAAAPLSETVNWTEGKSAANQVTELTTIPT